ncbi:hypothetical protein BDR07DRAFT_1445034, partial [Suillus spraguei]
MSNNSCHMLLSNSFQLASTISSQGTSRCPPSAHCIGSPRCEEDRKQLWWNGMDRFLLNGRILQPCKEAVQRFEKISSEGHIIHC